MSITFGLISKIAFEENRLTWNVWPHMNSMWKCPHCTQTSNRGWNIQAHVLRKHNGFGTPINLMDNPMQLSTERDVIMELKLHRPSRIAERNSKNC